MSSFLINGATYALLKRDAARYRWLRSKASRGPVPFETVRCVSVEINGWARKLNPGSLHDFWSSLKVTGAGMDREIDLQMKRQMKRKK